MRYSETEQQEEELVRNYKSRSFSGRPQASSSSMPKYRRNNNAKSTPSTNEDSKEEILSSISWPIILAIIPTLGAFIAGSAEVWSDFIMILLILYYVFKWITVPWSYYESARSRRMIHEYAAYNIPTDSTTTNKRRDLGNKRKDSVKEELRRHELIGLVWVIISPGIAGYTLQYSRYFLSNYDKYMSSFNVTVFILAATIKPLIHVMALLRERTIFLQSEVQVNETEIEILQKKFEIMEEELDTLRKAFATKKDLGQVANGITPSIENLSKAIKRFEKKETALRSWSEDRFTEIDQKVQDFDQFIVYSIEQDQKKSAQRVLVTLMFLPMNLTFWAAKRMTGLLPIPRALLGFTATKSSPTRANTSYRHLTHPDISNASPTSSPPKATYLRQHATTARDPSEVSYSG